MPANYVLLNRVELISSAASVTFSNIPQSGYTDLKLVMSARDTEASVNNAGIIQFNGETATTNYSARWLYGTGSTAASLTRSGSGAQFFYESNSANSTSNTFANIEFYIPNYLSSNAKSVSVDVVTETNATNTDAILVAGLWNNTAAINSILLKPNSGLNWVANSTFSLYGLAAVGTTPATYPKATGGSIVTTDGTYWYHAFLASGLFTPNGSITCDYLVIAGGGGAGGRGGGGGGAGGYRTATSVSLTSQAYAVQVGAGGIAGTGTNSQDVATNGNPGSNSIFSSTTATGGGRGGGTNGQSGGNGGSGGGGGAQSGTAGSGNSPSVSPSQGNNGTAGSNTYATAGAGGGAGAAGGAAGTSAGNGGAGLNTLSAWASATGTGVSGYYAGGGGGGCWDNRSAGSGGSGGGGAGGSNGVSGTAGTYGTGGGGGGGGHVGTSGAGSPGGNGGSGIVIVRYAV